MVKFNYFESELLNSFFEGPSCNDTDKVVTIKRLEDARSNTDDPELVQCASDTISKIKMLDNEEFKLLISSLPISDGFSI